MGKKGVDPKGFKIADTLIISFMLFGATGFDKNSESWILMTG